MVIKNKTKNSIIAEKVTIADTPFKRAKGLLGKRELSKGECLIIKPCNSVHMFFMCFPIDALFIDKNNCVVGVVQNLLPYRLSPIFFKAAFVIEIPAGTIQTTKTEKNDLLLIE
jgi:uncharacterized protein